MDNVELEEKDIFGKEGNGFNRGIGDFNFERWLVGASDYGMSIAVYEDACRHANQRIAFGKPIGRQQLNQLKVAEMAIKLKNMKNMLYETAWEADNNDGKFDPGAAAMCKYYCANPPSPSSTTACRSWRAWPWPASIALSASGATCVWTASPAAPTR